MLRQRLLTGVPAALAIIGGTLLLPQPALAVVAAAVMLAAAWEWSRLAGLGFVSVRAAYLLLLALITGVIGWLAGRGWPDPAALVLIVAVVWWIGVTVWLLAGVSPRPGRTGPRAGWLAIGLLVFPAFVCAIGWIAALPEAGRALLLFAICLVWAADIGAYAGGRMFGRHRLAPSISGGKTWEGVAGGLVSVTVYALGGALLLDIAPGGYGLWLSLALAAALLSISGDLLESVLKREAGVKDSGTLMPGHGGLLDRVDSLLAALPLMALGLGWFPGVSL